MSTLNTIRVKVRRLTRAPSANQLTDAQIDDYVNTFVLYDMPEHLRLNQLRQTFTFYTNPNIDTYETNTLNVDDPLYDFKNKYITVHQPIYIGGALSWFSQNRTEFYNRYPLNNFQQLIGIGNNVTTVFNGTLSQTGMPFLQNNVTVSAYDTNGASLALKDVPTGVQTGNLVDVDSATVRGAINYLTGVYAMTFGTAPGTGTDVNIAVRPYVAAKPNSLLYFESTFIVRPVPEQVYPVQMEVYKRPTQLLNVNQSPELEQWWQYIAYGAAKKVFEDRMDIQSVQMIMPEFKKQEGLVLRRTIVQQTDHRVATIYNQAVVGQNSNNGNFSQ